MFDFDATLLFMALQFLLLTAVLNVVFFKPLTNIMGEREDYIRSNNTEARNRLEQAKQLAQQYEQELAETRRKSQSVIATAQAEANKIAAAQIAEAQQEVQAELMKVQQELDQQKQAAFSELAKDVDTLSRQILDKLLGAGLAA